QNLRYRNSNGYTYFAYSTQADYIQILHNKATLKAGVKYSTIKRDNNFIAENYIGNNWTTDTGLTSRFIYKESLLMFYSSLEKRINKTNIQAGLRGEETFSRGNSVTLGQRFSRDYFGLFPSLFITQLLNEKK